MNITIGLLAHVDAGKTTFAEQLLYHTNSIRERGRVDYKNAFMDSHEIEKQRGITIFSDQAVFNYKNSTYFLIDTPGHIDFSSEMERAIQVMDYAIIIVSAVEGIEAHTETVWKLLRKYKVPTIFFINKADRTGADIKSVLEELKTNFSDSVFDIAEGLNHEIEPELIEFIAERDESLLEKYLEDHYNINLWLDSMRSMIKECRIFPCSYGSALQDIGITTFLDKLNKLTFTKYDVDNPFSGKVYKIRHDISGARITYIKALSGYLKVRAELCYGSNELYEKVTQIRIYNGSKFKTVEEVKAGELFAVSGLSEASAGQSLGSLKENTVYELIPTLKSKVIFDNNINPKDVLKCFKILDDEDPSLKVAWVEALQEIHISVMGVIQLEVLEQLVKERFNLIVGFGTPEIIYKETIASDVNGYGHFEPLKHYAEVHLRIEPNERGKGVSFESTCHTDNLPVGLQNVIGHYILEKEHHGLLTGSSLTDVKVTLLTGASHIKHTTGGDFREAAYRALRQGLEKAVNIVLEPYYEFKIIVDMDKMGRVLSDIQSAHGNFNPPKMVGNKAAITGKVPVASFMNYSTELAALTQGKGTISLAFGGYYPCHNEEEVIKKKSYNKNADIEYTSSSIFCSKGQAYIVSWDKAESEMQLLK